MDKVNLAYIAGIVDGEGTINLFKSKNSYLSRVAIYNTNYKLASWIKDTFGGAIYEVVRNSRHKKCYTWLCDTEDQASFLIQILPYLIVKRKQAELLISFREAVCCGRIKNSEAKSYNEFKQTLVDNCRALNRRGT